MPFKILSILIGIALSLAIPILSFLEYSKAENTREEPPLQQDLTAAQNAFSETPHLQDVHNFETIFDDSYFGGMPYE
jgi:hypothetical protein